MSATQPTWFDPIARGLDVTIGAVRQGLEESGITVTDWSNRQPRYDPLRSIHTFVRTHSASGEQSKVTDFVSMIEPTDEGEQPVITVTTMAERIERSFE